MVTRYKSGIGMLYFPTDSICFIPLIIQVKDYEYESRFFLTGFIPSEYCDLMHILGMSEHG